MPSSDRKTKQSQPAELRDAYRKLQDLVNLPEHRLEDELDKMFPGSTRKPKNPPPTR
jgi:hypothetical protein